MKPVTILKRAKKLIETKGWCQGEVARDAKGKPVGWHSPQAVSFCAIGAMTRAAESNFSELYDTGGAYEIFADATDQGAMVSDWNDREGRTKEEVLAAFDRAIASLQQPAKGEQ